MALERASRSKLPRELIYLEPVGHSLSRTLCSWSMSVQSTMPLPLDPELSFTFRMQPLKFSRIIIVRLGADSVDETNSNLSRRRRQFYLRRCFHESRMIKKWFFTCSNTVSVKIINVMSPDETWPTCSSIHWRTKAEFFAKTMNISPGRPPIYKADFVCSFPMFRLGAYATTKGWSSILIATWWVS